MLNWPPGVDRCLNSIALVYIWSAGVLHNIKALYVNLAYYTIYILHGFAGYVYYPIDTNKRLPLKLGNSQKI